MKLLEGKVALITGCSRGIGRSTMERFAQEKAVVYANTRNVGDIDNISKELSNSYETKVVPCYFDIRDKNAIKECVMKIKAEQGKLDVLVNNAGIMKDALIEMVDDTTLQDTFDINVFSMIHMTQMALKLMKRGAGGSIINLSSIVGIRGGEGKTVYAASKGAVVNLTMTWARELVKNNIRVNALAPGKIDTDMYQIIGEDKAGIKDVGMKRLGKPEEVANAALFLASDLSSYITGEIIGVNGGWFL